MLSIFRQRGPFFHLLAIGNRRLLGSLVESLQEVVAFEELARDNQLILLLA